MYIRSFRPLSLPGPPPRRQRRFPWARTLLILAIVGAVAYFWLPRYYTLSADGIVEGALVPITPLFESRIDSTLVQCADNVHKGQPIAVVTNFLLEGDYAQNTERAVENLNTEQIAEVQGLSEAEIAVQTAQEAYEASVYNARKLETAKNAYQQTYEQGAIGKIAYQTALAQWQAAQAQSQSLRAVWNQSKVRVGRIRADNAAHVASSSNQVALLQGLQNQVRTQTLTTPVSGQVVECTAQPQAVVAAGAPLYKIFASDRAFVLAFFDPKDAASIHIGQQVWVSLPGVRKALPAHVVALYPSVSRLPDELIRYFWQHEQWSEYRPVKIAFDRPSRVQSELAYDAQVRVEITRHRIPFSYQISEIRLP